MGDWKTFADKIKELLKSRNLSAAKEELAIGLEKIPNQINLLIIAADVYRASGDREKSLEYSELLITHHPENLNGYARAAMDLIALKSFDEAKNKIKLGKKISTHAILTTLENNINNDVDNLDSLFARSNILYPQANDISTSSKKNVFSSNSQETFCFLIRCTHYKDELAQQLREQISKHVEKSDIWFVHDSDEQNKTINLISVSQFRKAAGLDWSIIGRKGWLFGDFCYYAALHSGLDYDKYFLVEDDVRFTGDALTKLLLETKNDPTDFLAASYSQTNSQQWHWLNLYSYAHPRENAEVRCLFPLSRASNELIKYLFHERRKEFQAFYENHEFSVIEASRYFPNDEAFVCNSTHNSNKFTTGSIPKSLIDRYFSWEGNIYTINDIKGDHIIHRYCPNPETFSVNIKKHVNGKFLELIKQNESINLEKVIYSICIFFAINSQLNTYTISKLSHELRILCSKNNSDLNFNSLEIPDFLRTLSSCQNTKGIIEDQKLDDHDALIRKIHNSIIPPNSTESASTKDFTTSTINNSNLLKLVNQIHLPYSFEENKIHYIATDSSVIDSGFLYMNQRANGKFLISKELQKIKPLDFDSKNLILIFSQGRCGSTLISNLLRHFEITSICECDALTQAIGNETAIKRIVESFYSSTAVKSQKIAFKFRAETCNHVKSYLKAYPNAQYIFVKRSPLDWAKSYSSKFKWSAEQMHRTYLIAFKCAQVLAYYKPDTLFLDYDSNSKWPNQLMDWQGIFVNSELHLNTKDKLLKELSKDSQSGFVDNTQKNFSESEIGKFISMKLPSYDW